MRLSRRGFLGGLGLSVCDRIVGVPAVRADGPGPLLPPDANGLELPPGFSSRVVAQTATFVGPTAQLWHTDPDGGATFATGDGGWIYVSNSERAMNGGAAAIRFAADGAITDAYSILSGTRRNCAGGPTPWGTWLSCEEAPDGCVYECDPFTPGSQGVARPALGLFRHEAAAVDPVHGHVYLTEDQPDGRLYRFTPDVWPSLASGLLEVAEIDDGALLWHPVPDPTGTVTATRHQVPASTRFGGGEGCAYQGGYVVVCASADGRVWRVETATQTIELLYQAATHEDPILIGPDNVFAAPNGDAWVAEDGGDLEIVALTPAGELSPLVRLDADHDATEITGPALSPDGTRLYFSSQRAPGRTYEVRGPFLSASPSVPTGRWLLHALLAAAIAALARRSLAPSARAQ